MNAHASSAERTPSHPIIIDGMLRRLACLRERQSKVKKPQRFGKSRRNLNNIK